MTAGFFHAKERVMLIKIPQGQAIEYSGEGTLKEILVQEKQGNC